MKEERIIAATQEGEGFQPALGTIKKGTVTFSPISYQQLTKAEQLKYDKMVKEIR